jgi:disulfide bond formation protein DsbB
VESAKAGAETMTLTAAAGRTQVLGAGLAALGMAVTVGTALGFQHIGGYIPCKLCLEQRLPYYIGIPVAVLALVAAVLRLPPLVVRGLLLVVALLMIWSIWLGVFHSGIEWGFWPGPADCGAVLAPPAGGGNLLDQLDAFVPPSCDQAAGRFLGLSFAGWNVVASVVLAAIAWVAALRKA